MKKKILFLTGTRADYGKIKPLMKALENDDSFEVFIFVCGMHLLNQFGNTYREVLKDGYQNVYVALGLNITNNMSMNLGSTIQSLQGYVSHISPDAIVVHGDRMDALAGATVGALNNIVVAHIEGGELSGTIDESIRHAISKFAHIHFVCTDEAKKRLLQLGEEPRRIYVIGSPDIDVMLNEHLPSLGDCRKRYEIPFEAYGILMYHPVTTEYDVIENNIKAVIDGVKESGENYIVIYPNNDLGSEAILSEYKKLKKESFVRMFPSVRFEYFLTLLKNAKFIMGNSSAGIRESGVYGVPAIDIGTRQNGRYLAQTSKNIQHVNEDKDEIVSAIKQVESYRQQVSLFGKGNSTNKFLSIIKSSNIWNLPVQKRFVDL